MLTNRTKLIFPFLLILGLIGCGPEQESDELTLQFLQKDEIASSNQYKMTAVLDVFDFNAYNVKFKDKDSLFELTANGNRGLISITLPYLDVRTFRASRESLVSINYFDDNNRFFTSNLPGYPNTAIIQITSIDTSRSFFSGNFSGLLYDPSGLDPGRTEDQINVNNGTLVNVRY